MDNAAHCPSCGAELAPQGACPRCAITAPGERPPPDTHIAPGEPAPPPPELAPGLAALPAPALSTGWAGVQNALTVLHVGLVLGFLGSLALVIGFAVPLLEVAGGHKGAPVATWVGPLMTVGGLAFLAGWVIRLVGQCTACSTPAESGARGWALRSMAFGLISLIAGVLATAMLVFAVGGVDGGLEGAKGGQVQPQAVPGRAVFFLMGFGLAALVASGLAALAEVVCLALCLRAVARFLGASLLARRAGEYARFFVTFAVMLFALNVLSGFLLGAIPGDPETKARMVPILLVMEMVCYLILAAQLLGLVRETRDTVAHARIGTPAGQPPPSG